MSEESGQRLSLQELPDLRRKNESVSRFLREQMAAHLETLRPLLTPGAHTNSTGGLKLLAERANLPGWFACMTAAR